MDRHTDCYVPDSRYKPARHYFEHVLAKLPASWRLKQDYFWTYALAPRNKSPVQGWKIHVSALPESATRILDRTIPVCLAYDTEFKFASDLRILHKLLGKTTGRQSSGKFITIYPRHAELCRTLLEALYDVLRDEPGPYILSDRQYKDASVLFYRYGGFASFVERSLGGDRTHNILNDAFEFTEDERRPRFVLPAFVDELFPEDESEAAPDSAEPPSRFDTDYGMIGSIKHSNAGGVYVARDRRSGAKVLVKEARPHIGLDGGGSDAIARLEKEHRLLTRLADTQVAPRALALFQEWQHAFLVQEFIEGPSLRQFLASSNRLIHGQSSRDELNQWLGTVTRIAITLLDAVAVLHAKGIVFGDLSPNNLIIDAATLELWLIDFEGAYEAGVDRPINIYTPGFCPRERIQRNGVDVSDDHYALGCVILSMLAPNVTMAQWNPEFVRRFFDELSADFDLPGSFVSAVETLLAAKDVDLSAVRRELCHTTRPHQAPRAELDLQATVNRILAYHEGVMDVSDPERPLPVTAMMDDCMAVDRGMLGIAYAWQTIRGEIPARLRGWIEQHYRPNGLLPGLMNGLSGTSWVLSELGMEARARESLALAANHRQLFEAMSLGSGAAGHGLSRLYFWQKTQDLTHLAEARRIADVLCDESVERGEGCAWDLDASQHVQIGWKDGAAGIALFLLYAYCATKETRYLETGERGLAHDLAFGRQMFGAEGFPRSSAAHTVLYPYLAHGTAGIGTVALRYYAVTGKELYLRCVQRFTSAVTQKYAITPDLFLGLAGLGNYLLDVSDVLGDESYRERAHETARGLRLLEVPRPEGITFPYVLSNYVNCDYASGSAGVATFLHRLLHRGANTNFMLDDLLPDGIPPRRHPITQRTGPAPAGTGH